MTFKTATPLVFCLLASALLTGCGEETPKLENGQAAPACWSV